MRPRAHPWTGTLMAFMTLAALALAGSSSCRASKPAAGAPPTDRHQPYNFVAERAMVVAASPLAAEAGRDMLRAGGNAVDAAVATAFALNVTEPFASGMAGGGFMVLYLAKENRVTVIDFRERAPAAARPDMYIENGQLNRAWRETHGLAVAVPGALAGWDYALKKYGCRTLRDVTHRAVELAEQGYAVSPTFSSINKDEYERLLAMAGEDSCYLNSGLPYEPGDTFRNPDLAATLRLIAEKGADVFYRGELAAKIVAAVREKGGLMTLQDLASFAPVEVKPLQGTYKSYALYTAPPPASGGLHAIQLLNVLENWDVRTWGHNSAAYIHHFAEALRFAFADRDRYLADPEFAAIPTAALLDKAYAAGIARRIKSGAVLGDYPHGGFDPKDLKPGNTTHVCVIDREGSIVALTQSLNFFFGSCIVPRGTGFLLNDQMDDFAESPESLNAPGPRRRPLSSMAPLILFEKGRPVLVLGSPGGTRIFSTLVQIILNVVEFGLTLDEAIEAPRFFSFSSSGRAEALFCESRLPEATRAELAKLGHAISLKDAYDKYFGGAQGLRIFPGRKLVHGGADSRRDGFGAGY